MKYICAVCNYDGLFEPPYDEMGVGSYEICPCCGFEFGYGKRMSKESMEYCRNKLIREFAREYSVESNRLWNCLTVKSASTKNRECI